MGIDSEMKTQNFIGMIIATKMEAEPFIEGLCMKEMGTLPFPVYMGGDAVMIISGIGKVNAGTATAYACLKFDPARILNLGAAGSVNNSEELGRAYNIEKTIEPDRIHLRTNSPYIQYPDTMDGFEKKILATQDKGIIDVRTFRELAPLADLVDMEGASVLQASRRFEKKCLIFKFVTDTPEHAGQGKIILEHIKNLRRPFGDFILNSVMPAIRN
jgi:adenosylhomocysteine nucleosidase